MNKKEKESFSIIIGKLIDFFGVKQLYCNIFEQIHKKTIFALIKELFESMRNIVFLNSLAFSYPLPILMRVEYNSLIVK